LITRFNLSYRCFALFDTVCLLAVSLEEFFPQAACSIGWLVMYQYTPYNVMPEKSEHLAIKSNKSIYSYESKLNNPAQHRIHHIDHDEPISSRRSSITNDWIAPFVLLSCCV
jgi:hypothetical protein